MSRGGRQSAVATEVGARWLARGMNLERVDPDEARTHIARVYAAEGVPAPEFVFCASPGDFVRKARDFAPDTSDPHAPSPPGLWSLIERAQTQHWPRLGGEVDIDCNNRFVAASSENAVHASPLRRLARILEPLAHIRNAIEATLMGTVTDPKFSWLVFSGTSLHSVADNFAVWDALFELGQEPVERERFELAKLALFSPGSIYAFEKVCFVCDRPESLSSPQSGPHPRVTTLRFPDGFEARHDGA